jgi:hypothetical protein
MDRRMADCRRFESDDGCSLTIIGEEDEVVETAVMHAVAAHGHEESEEMRRQIRDNLESEADYRPGARTPEPFPG